MGTQSAVQSNQVSGRSLIQSGRKPSTQAAPKQETETQASLSGTDCEGLNSEVLSSRTLQVPPTFSFFQFDFIPISLDVVSDSRNSSINSTCTYTVLPLPPRRTFPPMCYRFSSSHLHLRLQPHFPTFLFAASLPQPT